MNTKQTGDFAESVVSDWLQAKGYKIIARNWRTKWCEIDIIATNKGCVHFVEVKYRKSDEWGSGLEYITSKKQQQMRFAAELWMQENGWEGDCLLSAASVNPAGIIEFIEDINY